MFWQFWRKEAKRGLPNGWKPQHEEPKYEPEPDYWLRGGIMAALARARGREQGQAVHAVAVRDPLPPHPAPALPDTGAQRAIAPFHAAHLEKIETWEVETAKKFPQDLPWWVRAEMPPVPVQRQPEPEMPTEDDPTLRTIHARPPVQPEFPEQNWLNDQAPGKEEPHHARVVAAMVVEFWEESGDNPLGVTPQDMQAGIEDDPDMTVHDLFRQAINQLK